MILNMAIDATNKLSAIDAEMGQLNNERKECRRSGRNFLLRSVRTIDPVAAKAS